MREEPLVSIVVAAYNVEKWIRQCLESIRSLKYRNFECIVVDDHGLDGAPKIIDEFVRKDSRFQHIRHDRNMGLFCARKTGLKHCKGKYVWQIDGDDYVDPYGLWHMVQIAERERSDVVRGQYLLYRNGKAAPAPWSVQWPEIRNTNLGSCLFLPRLPFAIWLNLVRKEFLDSLDYSICPTINLGEDLIFNAVLFANTDKISLTSRIVYNYRQGQESYTTTHVKKRLYLDESVCHAFTAKYWRTFLPTCLIFSINNSPFRVLQAANAVAYLPSDQALEVIANYQSIYKRWHPEDSYQIATAITDINWFREYRPDIMDTIKSFHECEPQEVYDLLLKSAA